jgi:FAD/FMN-containing dehydrogenase
MTAAPAHLASLPIGELRAALTGPVTTPADPGYEEACAVPVGGIDRRPAVIVQPADAAEVARVVTFARTAGAELAVRGGGHSIAGHGVCDGGVMLDLRGLHGLDIDVECRTAWAGAGLTAGEYTTAASVHGLATGFGDTASVGIGGLTLGGGIGFLARKHGLTIDSLLAAEVVTADGQIRLVDADHHPDLFWALRGGGGNFGVVTRFRFRLHEVDTVVGGLLGLPATPETVAGFVAAADAAPEELTATVDVMLAPPLPFVPPEQHGRPVIFAALCYAGADEAGERAVAPFRALAAPFLDTVAPMPYRDIYIPEEEGRHCVVMRTVFCDALGRDAAGAILDRLPMSTAPMASVHVRVLGGAVARVPAEATAFAHRARRIMAFVGAFYERPEETAEHETWVADTAAALPHQGEATYVNFLGDAGVRRVRDAYPGPTWDRLAAVKARYDPTNLFRGNHNIQPAPA